MLIDGPQRLKNVRNREVRKRRRRNPYQRIQWEMRGSKPWAIKMPSLELIYECLQYWLKTQKPLPNMLIVALLQDAELLLSGREGIALKKRDTLSNHPRISDYRNAAVSYVNTCKKHGYDNNPIKTVCESYEITRQTYYRWKKIHAGASSDIEGRLLIVMLELSSEGYKLNRISKTGNVH